MKRLIPFSLVFVLLSCGKEDSEAPVVQMITPSDNQAFTGGQTVNVKATITDNEGIHEVMVTVVDNTGGHILHFDEHYDGKTYNLNQSFTVQTGKTYTIEIEAMDHNDNTGKKTLTVTGN